MFELFSITHYLLLLLIPVVIYIAYLLRNNHRYKQILFSISFSLFIMECFKQYYYYFILKSWEIWIIPWQLCSIPLYIWIFYPFFKKPVFEAIETFLIDFTILGAILALGYPEDMIKPQLILTIHSFLWHYLLILMSSYVYFSQRGNLSIKGYLKGAAVFLICAFIALMINYALGKYDYISMFYLDPYHISMQPVFHTIGLQYGIMFSNLCYIVAILSGSFLFHLMIRKTKFRI